MAFSAPQTGHSVFMFSAVQAVSQLHTGGVSVLSSAKAAVGSSVSTIQHMSRMLSSRFFIVIPHSYYKVVVIRVPLQGQNATIDKVLWIG